MQSAIAILAAGLILACVAALTYVWRHHKMSKAAIDDRESGPAHRA
ncbi:MAG TPA: hypothetical protein VLJ19_16470 [Variovorax sp.]|nr:hypothetical protein [Variovorax sp.]